MKTTRFLSIISVGFGLGGLAACGPALIMNAPVSKTAEGWNVTLSQVKEGPDEYIGEGGVLVAADTGEKLVWTVLNVKNASSEEQTFSYDACFLDGKTVARRPLVVDRYAEINAAADRAEALVPGKESTRQLIYSLPEKEHPVRMRCENVTLPIKATR